jgi:4-amino-4-deoxychorismate lyase
MRVLALLDGTVLDPDTPALTADDLGVLRGDGVFETVLVVGGRPRKLPAHLERLANSAAMLDLPVPAESAWRRCVGAVCDTWQGAGGEDEMALKLVITRGRHEHGPPTGYALGMSVPDVVLRQRREGVAVLALDRGYPAGLGERAPWLLIGAKTLSYAVNMAAVRYAQAHGADDVIFVSSDGWVLEGPTSTVVVASGRSLRTPPTVAGILPGTTQQLLFRAAEQAGWATKSEPLRLADLHAADGVWLISSVRQLARVHTLDGEPLTDAGLTDQLRALLDEAPPT